MSCRQNCNKDKECGNKTNNNFNYVYIVLILYILLSIIIGGRILY